MMLESALEHYRRQARITAAALVAADRFDWRDSDAITRAVALFQVRAARESLQSVAAMLAEQDIDAPLASPIAPTAFAGTASDGRTLTGLFSQAETRDALRLMVATQVQDAARAASATSIAGRKPKDGSDLGYVRVLNPPSCSRCAILAGKFFEFNAGFERHPRCDCRHVPTTAENAPGLTFSTEDYFDSLSAAEQDKIFTKAGAEAIRLGADIGQVVNARRRASGLRVAGTSAIPRYTTEGMSRRGLAYLQRVGIEGRSPVNRFRLMPEAIIEAARDRDEAIELLRLYGYLLDAEAIARGRQRTTRRSAA